MSPRTDENFRMNGPRGVKVRQIRERPDSSLQSVSEGGSKSAGPQRKKRKRLRPQTNKSGSVRAEREEMRSRAEICRYAPVLYCLPSKHQVHRGGVSNVSSARAALSCKQKGPVCEKWLRRVECADRVGASADGTVWTTVVQMKCTGYGGTASRRTRMARRRSLDCPRGLVSPAVPTAPQKNGP